MNNQRGFTLLEVIVALAIVAIVSGPLLQTFVTSAHVGQRTYQIDKASAAAVETVETIRGLSLESITSGESRFSYDEETKEYTRTDYYDGSWKAATQPDAVFRLESSLSSAAISEVKQSYIELLGEGESGYYIEADYGKIINEATLTAEDTEETCRLSAGSAILRSSNDGTSAVQMELDIPKADCAGSIPLVVEVPSSASNRVTLWVDNRTGADVNLYIYGDLEEPYWVTAGLAEGTMGSMNVSRMKVSSESLSFNKMELRVRTIRIEDEQELTDYTTMLYFAG